MNFMLRYSLSSAKIRKKPLHKIPFLRKTQRSTTMTLLIEYGKEDDSWYLWHLHYCEVNLLGRRAVLLSRHQAVYKPCRLL